MLSTPCLYAQNLESIGKEKPLTITGGLSLNQIVYAASGINSRRDPYSYFASGNINFNFYGWSVPLSFTLSNQNFSYQQPFNQYGLHPTYKWATAHIGYSSMSFSPYTLNGHIFSGVGVDLAPGDKFKFSAMYGRLLRAVQPDTIAENPPAPSFKRMGFGFKARYGDSKYFGEVSLFRAKDDTTSIDYIPEKQGVLPQENLVMSIGGGVTFFQKLLLKGEFASSAITRDIRYEESSSKGFHGAFGNLFTPRISTSYYKAMKGNLSYTGNGYTVGLGYERVDPEYRTLGAYFFNSDLENITVNGATALAGGRVNVSANVGTQRDNLDKSKVSTMRRWVSSLSVGFVPNDKLNVSANYSNFQTYTNIRSQFVDINQLTPYDNLDTLNFTQITQNITVNANYALGGNEQRRQSLSANVSIMKAADRQGEVEQNTGSMFYNMNGGYSMSLIPKNLTLSLMLNWSQNRSLSVSSSTLGPTLSVSKALFDKKMRLSGALSMNNTYTDGSTQSRVYTARVNTSYSVKRKH
ncbi:MAG TPA: hypothetical protein VFM90_00565, partial [Cyclobacteriaceae bacterium]|nr:hypothetical protein [Cyclobacteriaceae bacterium]